MSSFKPLLRFCLLSPEFFSKPEHFYTIKSTFDSNSGFFLDTNIAWAHLIKQEILSLDYNEKKRAANLFKKLRNYKYGYLDENNNSWNDSLNELNKIINFQLFYFVPKSSQLRLDNSNIKPLEYPECMDNNDWNIPHNILVPRIKKELRDVTKPLLQYSKNIIFIDPYFHPGESRFINTLKSWLEVLKKHTLCENIIYYFKDRVDFEKEQFKYEIEKSVLVDLLHDFRGKIKFISIGNNMHDRFILSDFSGFNFSYGLDEDKREKINKVNATKTSVTRLSQEAFNELKQEYGQYPDNPTQLIVNYIYSLESVIEENRI